jgi:hypothetical protein
MEEAEIRREQYRLEEKWNKNNQEGKIREGIAEGKQFFNACFQFTIYYSYQPR